MNLSKKDLIDELKAIINKKTEDLKRNISKTEEARDTETKSSMGDKYETGRTLMQIELGQYKKQLEGHLSRIQSLNEINSNRTSEIVEKGALVETDSATYFISIGFGEFIINEKKIYVISLNSPIGKELAGLKINDRVTFNGKTQIIKRIS